MKRLAGKLWLGVSQSPWVQMAVVCEHFRYEVGQWRKLQRVGVERWMVEEQFHAFRHELLQVIGLADTVEALTPEIDL